MFVYIRKKGLLGWLFFTVLLVGILTFGLLVFESHYKRQLWDPEMAALVNGSPINVSMVEEVMNMSFRTTDQDEVGVITIRQILDKLIEEELVMQASAKAGIVISDEELDDLVKKFWEDWGCEDDPALPTDCGAPQDQELELFKRAVRQQVVFERITSRIVRERARHSGKEWRELWGRWLHKYTVKNLYIVRLLLAQDTEDVKKIMQSRVVLKGGLTELESRLKTAGFSSLVSRTMILNPLDPEMDRLLSVDNLEAELTLAFEQPGHLSRPIKLPESLAVVEVSEIKKSLDIDALVGAARNSYDRQVADRAYKEWLLELRESAEIEYNPSILAN